MLLFEISDPAEESHSLKDLVSRPGLEPGTHGLKGRCSTD